MRFRVSEILAPTTIGTAGTETIDIKTSDVISRLVIRAEVQDKTNRPSGHLQETISKIEIVDGSEVIYELTGMMANAADFYQAGRAPFQRLTYVDDFYPRLTFNLWFGRYLWDTEWAFDPKRFNNPQIKITWDADAVLAGASDVELSVFADVFPEGTAAPVGFLMSKEVYSYAMSNDAHEYVDLPLDYDLRQLYVQARYDAQYFYTTLNGLRLNIDQGKLVPYDLDGRELEVLMCELFGFYEERVRDEIQTANAPTYITPHERVALGVLGEDDENLRGGGDDHVGGQANIISETSTNKAWLLVQGALPGGVVCMPFGRKEEPKSWLDVAGMKNLELRLLGGSFCAGADTARVAVQQARTY
ncbi:MAG: hypothetical protein GF410_01835 [Chitinivibrionales bacterium]|nr:hypothetical protein [Chitinivibrionales bacterium]